MDGKTAWSLQNMQSSKKIYISQQVTTLQTSKNIGTIFGEIDLAAFTKIFKNINLGDSTEIFILDSKGSIIASKDNLMTRLAGCLLTLINMLLRM